MTKILLKFYLEAMILKLIQNVKSVLLNKNLELPRLANTFLEEPEYKVLPICMGWNPSVELPSGTVQVAGWGKTENTTHSDVLLKVQVDMMMAKECKLNFPSFNFIADDDTQICAGGQKGKDSCNGDSGGPLMSLDGGWGDFKEPKYLRGIVSFGSQNCGTVRTFTM